MYVLNDEHPLIIKLNAAKNKYTAMIVIAQAIYSSNERTVKWDCTSREYLRLFRDEIELWCDCKIIL